MGSPRPPAAPPPGSAALQLVEALAQCACDVFATMVRRPLTPQDQSRAGAPRPPSAVVGTVGFTGSYSGLVVFSTSFPAALEITAGLLGLDADAAAASQDEVADAVGEITNMIAGSFRTRLATEGDAWAITVPTVTMGSDFYIKPMTSGQRTVLPFTMARHDVLVELIVTQNAGRR